MLAAAREYVHRASAGDRQACEPVREQTGAFLADAHERGAIAGYNLVSVSEAADCDEELIDDAWKRRIPETYPIIYAFVQPNRQGDPAFDVWMKAAGFILVK
jgi:hypothetical protein